MLTFLLDAPTGVPREQIQVAKLGDFTDPRYGEFSFTATEIQEWAQNLSRLPGGRAPIDVDHSPEKRGQTEAAGWITGVHLDGAGTPVADVEWTPLGDKAIREKRYLFFSPTIEDNFTDEAGAKHGKALIGGALTNRPFLNMPTVCLTRQFSITVEPGEANSDPVRNIALDIPQAERDQAAKDGHALPDGSYPIRNAHELHAAAVLAASGHGNVQAAKKLIAKRAKDLGVDVSTLPGFGSDSRRQMEISPDILKALSLDETADEAKILARIAELEKAPEPAVPDAKQLDKLASDSGKVLLDKTELVTLQGQALKGEQAHKQLHEMRFTQCFDKAVTDFRVAAGQRESYAKMFDLDADTTVKLLEEAPVIGNLKRQGAPAGQQPQGVDDKQTLEIDIDQKVLALCKAEKIDYQVGLIRVLNGEAVTV